MKKTPKSLRLQIGVFGRMNVGKSSFLNLIANQDVSITSVVPGTTTDVVEKTMEFHALGPVVFLDTAGVDDSTELGVLRRAKTEKAFERCDFVVLLAEADKWTEHEAEICLKARQNQKPLVIVVNKIDIEEPTEKFITVLRGYSSKIMLCSCRDNSRRDNYIKTLEENLLNLRTYNLLETPKLIGDLLPKGGLTLLIVPLDVEAPQGRIKMLQVQTIRDALDHDCMSMVLKETDYPKILDSLKTRPDLVICDSPVVRHMVENTPDDIKCTTFSVLMSRYKGDLKEQVIFVEEISSLADGDKILIAEACSHHPVEDDIGRSKIPQMIRAFTKKEINFEFFAGREFPQQLDEYKLIIHCGGCMLTRNEMTNRISAAQGKKVPITNYGVVIAYLSGVLERVLSPFPEARDLYRHAAWAKEEGNVTSGRA
ncbi:MAG: [FeFe] hydrogenase H-cluster maturation GTPase HydF [Candidatus Omnitrophica bacterium]|nr:[FeFe] hydrogenase H-cluster maturation GTPase HydF [Candidatus Omnitrophota bacterium]